MGIECGESNEEHCFYVQDFCTQARSTTWLAFGQSLQATVPTPRPTPNPIPQPMMTASKLGVCLCGFPELFCKVPGWSGTGKACSTSKDCSEGCGGKPTCALPPLLPIECGESNEEHCFYEEPCCVWSRTISGVRPDNRFRIVWRYRLV